MGEQTPRAPRVMFLGLDAADPGLLRRWAKDGDLPVLSSLMSRSARLPLRMAQGVGSGSMWVSALTGVATHRHGRYFGRQLRRDGYTVERHHPGDITHDPIWVAAARHGKRAAVIDVPVAPFREDFTGLQIKDWGTHDPYFSSVRTIPAELAHELVSRFGVDPVGSCDDLKLSWQDHASFRDRLIERVSSKASLCKTILARERWDLFLAVFADPHCVGHQAWHLHDPAHPSHDARIRQAVGDPVRDVYLALDRAVGELLELADPNTHVFLFAGSGMGPNYTGNHLLDAALRRIEGVKPPPERRSVEWLKAVYRRILPDALRTRLSPWAQQIDEASLRADRASRLYHALPHNDLSGAIRFNVIGRDPAGRVRPGDELDSVRSRLEEQLLELVDPDTGQRVVQSVVRCPGETNEIEGCWPDLFVVWKRDRPITALASRRIGELRGVKTSRRTGDHAHEALLCVSGPGIDPGDLGGDFPVEAIAPTLASILEVPLPDTDGVPIPGIVPAR